MIKQDEALRQQARQQRKMATIARAAQILTDNPELSRLEALTKAVTEHREAQNKKYSEYGKHV